MLAKDGVPEELRAFVKSSLDDFKSDLPCFDELIKNIEDSWAPLEEPGLPTQSWYHKDERYSSEFEIGWMTEFRQIYSNSSTMPKTLALGLHFFVLNQRVKNLAEIVVHFNDDQVGKEIAEIAQWLGASNPMRRMKRAPVETNSFGNSFATLYRRLYPTESTEANKHSQIQVDLRFYDREAFSFKLELAWLLAMITKDGDLAIDKNTEALLSGGVGYDTSFSSLLYETSRKIPTSIGIPLQVSGKAPLQLEFHFGTKIQLLPATGTVEEVSAAVDFKLRSSVMNVVTMSLWTPMLNMGIRIENSVLVNVALNGTVKLNFDDMKVTANFDPPQNDRIVFSIDGRTVVFTETSPMNPVKSELKELELRPFKDDLKEHGKKWPTEGTPYFYYLESVQPGMNFWHRIIPTNLIPLKNRLEGRIRASESEPASINMMVDLEHTTGLIVIDKTQNDDDVKNGPHREGWMWNSTIELNFTDTETDRVLKLELMLTCTEGCTSWKTSATGGYKFVDKNRDGPKRDYGLALTGEGDFTSVEAWSKPLVYTENVTLSGKMTMLLDLKGFVGDRRVEMTLGGDWRRSSIAASSGNFTLTVSKFVELEIVWNALQTALLLGSQFRGLIMSPVSLEPQLSIEVTETGLVILGSEFGADLRRTQLLGENAMRKFLKPWQQCHVQPNEVQTFDKTKYLAPQLPNCFVPIFQDCLAGALAIRTKTDEKRTLLDLKVNSPTADVSVVNGRVKCLSEYIPINAQSFICGSALITIHGQHKHISVPFAEIRFDEKQVVVAVSSLFQTKSCGICALYSGEKYSKNFLLTNGETTTNIVDLFKEQALTPMDESAAECAANLDASKYKLGNGQEARPIKKSRQISRDGLICVSLPLDACPEGSIIIKTTAFQTVAHHCFDVSVPLSAARKNYLATGVLEDFTGEILPPIDEDVKIPTVCRGA